MCIRDSYYRLEELEQLFEATKDHPYSLLIQITAFYGLRRSEALGLRWDEMCIRDRSWMVLWLCLQISKGEPVWGIPTRKTDVVYLALEDREWRIQQRMQELLSLIHI